MSWQVRSLGDVADLHSGIGFPPSLQGRMDGELPLAKVGDISRAVRAGGQGFVVPINHITRAEAIELRARIFPRGSTVFAKIGEAIAQNFRLLTDREAALDNNAMGAIPREGVEPRYLFRFLQTVDLYAYSSKTTVPALRKSELEQIQIPVPSPAEQRRIADILDKADAIRRKRKEAIALTEQLLRSAFLEMFGDPVTNPKGWPVKALGELLAADPRIGTLVPASDNPGTLVVRVGELGAYDIELSRSKRAALSDTEFERFGLETGDVCLARAIGSEDHLGKASVLQPHDEPVAFDSHVMRLRFRHEVLDPYVFVQWLRTPGGRARFMNEAGRTAVQFNVNGKQIVKVKIPLPPRAEQRLFRRLFDSVRSMECRSDVALGEAETLFNSLVARAFSGELEAPC